jgi:phosphatidylserine/phosphatidylglycerophosphate/cardiolipin synthase-like enzyme
LNKYNELNESYASLLSRGNLTGIIVLEDHMYLDVVKDLLLRANRSIYVAIYVVKYDIKEVDDPVNQLLYVLVAAHDRGLDVKVLVDDPTLRSYPDTISYLKNNSVEVRLDEKAGVTSHMKIVIVDGKYLVVGSHNWTESALSYNHEYSVLIISQHFSREAERYFMSLWSVGRSV